MSEPGAARKKIPMHLTYDSQKKSQIPEFDAQNMHVSFSN